MVLRLRDVANPTIVPESILPGSKITELPANVSLAGFKAYLGIAHNSEDSNLTMLLLGVLNDVARPTSMIGLPPVSTVWLMTVQLNGKSVIYLPRFNGGNYATLSYDENDALVDVEWYEVSEIERPNTSIAVSLIRTDATPLPDRVAVSWSVGEIGSDYPDAVKQMIYMEAGMRREFPLGLGDKGETLVDQSPASVLIRKEWQMITDLVHFVPE